jgi:hypothetical protein
MDRVERTRDEPRPEEESGDPRFPVNRREALILLTGALLHPAPAAALPAAPFRNDARLRPTLTIRVTRMPLAELCRRLEAILGVRLLVEGDDIADQKVDLFVTDLPAAEILSAISSLLNSEGPRGYRWERSGRTSSCRYTLVRDVASRQWEEARASEAEARRNRLVRERLAALGREPFEPHPDRPDELPGMRRLLASLSDKQIAQLGRDRLLMLTFDACRPDQRPLLKELLDQAQAASASFQRRLALYGPDENHATGRAQIYLNGDSPRWHIRIAVRSKLFNEIGIACRIEDTAATRRNVGDTGARLPFRLPGDEDPVFALPPRTSWLMGDVLADLAARGKVNLIADDYSHEWSLLSRYGGARSLSGWLTAIQDELGFGPARDGRFLRLRNRAWWLDRRREVPIRLESRWVKLLRGTPADRLQAAAEVAEWMPLTPDGHTAWFCLSVLSESPEIRRLCPDFVSAVAGLQHELRLYHRLTSEQQAQVTGPGLTLTWDAMSAPQRELFIYPIRYYLDPFITEENLRQSSVMLHFVEDRLRPTWFVAPLGRPVTEAKLWESIPPNPVAEPRHLLGGPLPELEVVTVAGKTERLRLRGPLLLLVAPVWPRPWVDRVGTFPELKAAQKLGETTRPSGGRVLVLGAGATAAELRTWWKERGVRLTPRAVTPESAQELGARHLPISLVVDRDGHVTWAKEGYADGDAEEWRRQLDRVAETPG